MEVTGARAPPRPWNLGLASVGNRFRGDEALLPKDKLLPGLDCDVFWIASTVEWEAWRERAR